MSVYKFVPNEFGKKLFNLQANEYMGDGLTSLFEVTLGKKNYDRYIHAQDHFSNEGDTSKGVVTIVGGQEIGTVYDLRLI